MVFNNYNKYECNCYVYNVLQNIRFGIVELYTLLRVYTIILCIALSRLLKNIQMIIR